MGYPYFFASFIRLRFSSRMRSRFPLTKRKFIPLAMAQRTRSHFQSFSFYFFASFIRLRFSSRMRSSTVFTALSTSALGMRASSTLHA